MNYKRSSDKSRKKRSAFLSKSVIWIQRRKNATPKTILPRLALNQPKECKKKSWSENWETKLWKKMTSSWKWTTNLLLKWKNIRKYSSAFKRKTSSWKNTMTSTQHTFLRNFSMKLKCSENKKETTTMSLTKSWAKWTASPGIETKWITITSEGTARILRQGMSLEWAI